MYLYFYFEIFFFFFLSFWCWSMLLRRLQHKYFRFFNSLHVFFYSVIPSIASHVAWEHIIVISLVSFIYYDSIAIDPKSPNLYASSIFILFFAFLYSIYRSSILYAQFNTYSGMYCVYLHLDMIRVLLQFNIKITVI